MKKKVTNLTVVVLAMAITVLSLTSCNQEEKEGFGLYLADSNELVLSNEHIESYSPDDGTFTLNAGGIEKWNSFHTYSDIPKLNDSLYNKEFIIRIDGEEICRGQFWSMVSSAIYSGYIIGDVLFPLDEEHTTIRLGKGYPGDETPDTDVFSKLEAYFE